MSLLPAISNGWLTRRMFIVDILIPTKNELGNAYLNTYFISFSSMTPLKF